MLNFQFFIGSTPNATITTSGGVELGGSADVYVTHDYTTSGGVVISGTGVQIYNETSSGGVLIGGASTPLIEYNSTTSGGVVISGKAGVTNIINGFVVPTIDDEEDFNVVYNQVTSGGVLIGGVALDEYIAGTGGVLVGGDADTSIITNITTSGGVLIGGVAVDEHVVGIGGVLISGTVDNTIIANAGIDTNSGVVIGGTASVSVTIDYTKVFTWEVNTGVSYWWRVEGDCAPLECPPVSMSDTCVNTPNYMALTYVMATDCNDLINKLNAQGWNWTIRSIKRYTLPVFTSDIPPGTDTSCNPILDIDFTDCVLTDDDLFAEDIEFTSDLDMELLVNAEPTSSYSFTSSGTIVISGDNEVNYSNTEIIDFNKDLDMELVEVAFTSEFDSDVLQVDSSTVILGCCSTPIPRILYLKHNLQFANDLYQFTKHNNIKLPDVVPLYYSTKTKIWQGNLAYQGLQYQTDVLQNWSLLFEFGWITKIGPTDLGGGVWKFSMYIVDHKPSTINNPSTYNTKFTTYFDNKLFEKSNPVGFSFTYNVQNKKIVPKNIIDLIYTDKIGLFKSKYWINNPLLKFNIQKDASSVASKFVKYPEVTMPIVKVRAGVL